MLDLPRIRAITLDLDDTLWPIWPTIHRAEETLLDWLKAHAPATAAMHGSPEALRAIREDMHSLRPELRHDLSGMRRESIRLALTRAGDDPALAEPAFDVFFDMRQRVDLFEDALPALEFLAAHYPLVAISNGNADIHRAGVGRFFRASISAHLFGVAKPDRRIFEAGAAAAGVSPHEVLHVGDDPALDIVGAQAAGMQTYWLTRDGSPWTHEGPEPHVAAERLDHLVELLKPAVEA